MSNESLPLWALDTEDDSKGSVKIINFYNGKRHLSFHKREDALGALLNDIGPAQIWACMAEYDLVNLFGEYMETLCEMTYLKSAFVKARLTRPGARIVFYDSLRHWKLSVKAMGERLGLKKLAFDPSSLKYCQRDTEIVWRWVKGQQGYYGRLGTTLNATIGSSALKLFRTNYQQHTSQIFDQEARGFLQEAVRGGRVEIFKTGVVHGNIECGDINSMYPSVMRSNPYPELNSFIETTNPDFERAGCAMLTLDYPNIPVPGLPYYRKKLIFPTGRLKGVWCYPEIRQAIQDGANILKVHRAIEFPSMCQPFMGYVDALYSRRKASQDDLERETLKLFMNNLFGKFGQKNGLELWRGSVVEERDTFSKDANMIWAAYTTCYARLELLKYLRKAGDALLYCDTDSIFTLNGPKFKYGDKLGELKYVGNWKTAHFVLPKVYMLANNSEKYFKAKGIPRKVAQQFFENYIAEYEAPIRFRESFRRSVKANVWVKKIRSLNQKYDKRIVLNNGNTNPINIS